MALAQALDTHVGVSFRFKINGKLFNPLHASRSTKLLIQELLFADDAAIVSDKLDDLQLLMDRISTTITNWVLKITIPKIKLLYQAVSGCDPPTTPIKNDNEDLEVVQSFKYLGSTISASLSLDNEINLRVSRASHVYGSLRRRVWNSKHFSICTKVRVYNAVVLPSLLYGCQTWSTYVRHVSLKLFIRGA